MFQSQEGEVEILMERMKKLTEESQSVATQEEMTKRFEKVESQTIERKQK